ncbi:MAG: FAD-dependent oxidoreductase [Bacteroidales bacterium]|nr:FAD-dependent oxidoreductase [Bacteroidales bacterium]
MKPLKHSPSLSTALYVAAATAVLVLLVNNCSASYQNAEEYDVCMVGGGAGGIGAGYALKDSGLKVCIIEREACLGGTHVNGRILELLPGSVPPFFDDLYARNNALFTFHNGATIDNMYYVSHEKGVSGSRQTMRVDRQAISKVYYEELSPAIDIKLRRLLTSAVVRKGVCKAIVVRNLLTDSEETIRAKVFIDCSGGELAKMTNGQEGTGYYWGSDGRDRFGETFYPDGTLPDRYDINFLEMTLRVRHDVNVPEDLSNVVIPQGVTATSSHGWTDNSDENCDIRLTSYHCNLSKQKFIDEGYDASYREALVNSLACWKLTKETYGQNTYSYDKPAPMLSIREGVRIICDDMLTQEDCTREVTMDDIADLASLRYIALSSWYIDIHGEQHAYAASIPTKNRGITYDMLIPRNNSNVLVGCRAFGCSHVAHAANRLTRTMLSLGNACGYAAEYFIAHGLSDVRDVDIDFVQDSVDMKGQIEKCVALY